MFRKSISSLCLLLPLSACLAAKSDDVQTGNTAENNQAEVMSLTIEQQHLYQDAVLSILPQQQTAQFLSVKTLKFQSKTGVHICGYTQYKNQADNLIEVPFYIEIRKDDETQKDTIHRGQVGTDSGKVAKVKFVCRHHRL